MRTNYSAKFGNEVSYRVYKNEFHPLFIAFLKGDSGMGECECSRKYNFYRETVGESEKVLTLSLWEASVPAIQEAMFKSPAWLAKEIWNNT
jgi:hypothetical protein